MSLGSGRSLGALLSKHQVGALVATAIDFVVMVGVVEWIHRSAVTATAIGAAAGAVANFMLGRRWIFQAGEGRASSQAIRYASVSAASLGLNAAGVFALAAALNVHYLAARVCTALAVSLLWNFPMHRYFVFRSAAR